MALLYFIEKIYGIHILKWKCPSWVVVWVWLSCFVDGSVAASPILAEPVRLDSVLLLCECYLCVSFCVGVCESQTMKGVLQRYYNTVQNFQANYARNSTVKPKKRHKWHYPYHLTRGFKNRWVSPCWRSRAGHWILEYYQILQSPADIIDFWWLCNMSWIKISTKWQKRGRMIIETIQQRPTFYFIIVRMPFSIVSIV